MSLPLLTETRERFLIAIVARIPAERIAEIHFFSPIKQGGVESGVAVVVERGDVAAPSDSEDVVAEPDVVDSLGVEDSPADDPEPNHPELEPEPDVAPATLPTRRYVVHTARYRLTLKGLDRGKWETHVFAEADAPLATVDAVVRGVQRRAGDVDDATRMDGDEVRAFVASRAAA